MKILLKRKLPKEKGFDISEDIADDIAERFKELKKKRSIESAWLSNGKVKYTNSLATHFFEAGTIYKIIISSLNYNS